MQPNGSVSADGARLHFESSDGDGGHSGSSVRHVWEPAGVAGRCQMVSPGSLTVLTPGNLN